MTDFYVYRLNANEEDGDRKLGFINDPDAFAKIYNPEEMEFSGVKIVANDPESAQYVYSNPTSDRGEYIICDEPQVTKVLTAVNTLRDMVERATMITMMHRLGTMNSQLNRLLSMIAKRVYDQSNKMMEPKQIYQMLKGKWCQQMVDEAEYTDGEAS